MIRRVKDINRIKKEDDKIFLKKYIMSSVNYIFMLNKATEFFLLKNTYEEYIGQGKEASKQLKGNKLKLIERAKDVEYEVFKDRAVISFK